MAVAVGLGVAVWQYGHSQREAGKREARLEAVTARVETLTVRVLQRDTVYREKLRTFTRWDTAYAHSTDTLSVVRDTGRVVYINRAIADSAVESCRQVVFALQSSCATKDTLITALRAQVKGLEGLRPSRVGGLLRNVLIFGAGVGAGSLLNKR